MIVFILILALLVSLAEVYLTRDLLNEVRADFRTDTPIAEPGETFFLCIFLENTGRRLLPFLKVTIFLPAQIEPQDRTHCTQDHYSRGCTLSYTTWLRPHQATQIRIPIRIAARGRYIFQPLYVSSGDFLGLKEERCRIDGFREIVVAPAEVPASSAEAAMSGFLGEISVRRFLYEDPVLSAGFHAYTGQEPMKKISWTQSAKGRGLMVKQDDYTAEPTVSVIVNADTGCGTDAASAPDETARLETCYSLTRAVCRTLEAQRIPHDVHTNAIMAGGWYDEDTCNILQGFGSVHFGKILELLGRATDTVSLSASELTREAAAGSKGCGVILITTAAGMPDAQSLQRLRTAADGCLLILQPETAEMKNSAEMAEPDRSRDTSADGFGSAVSSGSAG